MDAFLILGNAYPFHNLSPPDLQVVKRCFVKIWHLWRDDLLDIFYIGESELGFHLDGEINRDGWHRICMFIFCRFYWRWRTENTVRIWFVEWLEKQHIFHIFHFSFRGRSARRNRKKIVEFIFDFGRRNFVWHWLEKLMRSGFPSKTFVQQTARARVRVLVVRVHLVDQGLVVFQT